MILTFTMSSPMKINSYAGFVPSRMIAHAKRHQMQHSSYPSLSPARVSGVISSAYPSSSFSVGSSYRVAALHEDNTHSITDSHFAASSVVPTGPYSTAQSPGESVPYRTYFTSQVGSESSPLASYSSKPSVQLSLSSFNQDPYEAFVKMNPHIRTSTGN